MSRCICTALLLLVGVLHRAAADENSDLKHLQRIEKNDKVDVAIRKGLAYIVSKQNSRTGSFSDKTYRNTLTGLACLALMANGHFPGRSEYGENLRKGILFLLAQSDKHKAYFGHEGKGRMYTQAICVLALAEAYGMMPDYDQNNRIRLVLDKAVRIITEGQTKAKNNKRGGWHYHPRANSADLSVTAWQIQALRAVQNCKLEVQSSTIDRAIRYLRDVYNDRQKAFTYDGNRVTNSMRAAGVVGMIMLGADKTEEDKQRIHSSASFLLNVNPSHGNHYYYQSYYIALSSNLLGGKYENTALRKLEKALLALQDKKTGSFKKHQGEMGGVYSTAFAVICLSMRYELLPVWQN